MVFPGKAIYLHYCQEEKCEEAIELEKNYEYLLAPFCEQIICYGDTEVFQKVLAHKSGVIKTDHAISMVRGNAFKRTKDAFSNSMTVYTKEEREKYWFIYMFRIASRLNISMKWFYQDWPERLKAIYNDWKEDAPEEASLRKMVLELEEITRCIVDDIRNNNE